MKYVNNYRSFINEAVNVNHGSGYFWEYTKNHAILEEVFQKAFTGKNKNKLKEAVFFSSAQLGIKFKMEDGREWQLVYSTGSVGLEDHNLGHFTLWPYGPQSNNLIVFRVKAEGLRSFGDVNLRPADLKKAEKEFKNWVNKY